MHYSLINDSHKTASRMKHISCVLPNKSTKHNCSGYLLAHIQIPKLSTRQYTLKIDLMLNLLNGRPTTHTEP